MAKKLSLLLAAVAVFAFAIPAMANAAVGLTQGGSLVKFGTEIEGVSTNAVTTSSIGNVACEKVTLSGTITKNSKEAGVAGEGNGKSSTSKCFFKGTTAISITNIKLISISSGPTEDLNGKVSFSFEADLPGLTCKYTGTNVSGTISTGGVVTLKEAPLTVSPAACGTAKLDGDFTLTAGGSGVTVDST
jgi:hypothetical protein